MRVGEADPELRRFPLVVYLDDGVTLATDADVSSPPAHSFQVCVNGAAIADAAGHFVGDGAGEYYYEADPSEITAAGFIAFKLERPGYRTAWATADVGELFTVGETDPTKLRLPLVVYDNSSPPVLATVASTSPGELLTALNDVAFGNAAGALHFVGSGLHYYQGVAADATAEGTLIVKLVKAGFQTEVTFTDVSIAAAPVIPGATLVSLTPTPLTAPGDPGGFPVSPPVAATTPIVAVIAEGVPNILEVIVTVVVDGVEEIAYYAGLFRGRYALRSFQIAAGSTLTLSIARDAGWSITAGQMALTIEGISPSVFSMLLPTSHGALVPVSAPVSPGSIDHAAAMLARLPAQFKNKPTIEGMVRVLCAPIQVVENAITDMLSQLSSLDNYTGVKLQMTARLVGQPTAGFTDETVLRRFVKARIAANRSSGTIPQMIVVTRLVINSPGTSVSVSTVSIGTIVVTLLGVGTDPSVATILLKFLKIAKASGKRLKIVYVQTLPIFRFNSGPGFNVGHLASSIE